MKIGNSIVTPSWGDIVIWKHKSFEYQFEGPKFMNGHSFTCKLNWTRKRDHAGIFFTFGIKGLFWMNLNIHDHRHWDIENDTWMPRNDS
jgi:hypothetical protein